MQGWTNLAREVWTTDYASFVHIAAGLADTIADIEIGRPTMHEYRQRSRMTRQMHGDYIENLTGPKLLPLSAMLRLRLLATLESLGRAQPSNLRPSTLKLFRQRLRCRRSFIGNHAKALPCCCSWVHFTHVYVTTVVSYQLSF
jgi:hypothetical protein